MACGGVLRIHLSPRTELAINEAVALASQKGRRHTSVQELAEVTGAPLRELRTVTRLLQEAGLVERNGSASAFRWRRDPSRVSLYQVAAAVGERFGSSPARKRGSAARQGEDPVSRFLSDLDAQVAALFRARKLQGLLPAQR
jgi:DNA-binding IscR family transcriptional regulator